MYAPALLSWTQWSARQTRSMSSVVGPAVAGIESSGLCRMEHRSLQPQYRRERRSLRQAPCPVEDRHGMKVGSLMAPAGCSGVAVTASGEAEAARAGQDQSKPPTPTLQCRWVAPERIVTQRRPLL